jgi:hypothetical protein
MDEKSYFCILLLPPSWAFVVCYRNTNGRFELATTKGSLVTRGKTAMWEVSHIFYAIKNPDIFAY